MFQYSRPSQRGVTGNKEKLMANKILKKIQKKLERLDAFHEKEEAIINDIKDMIDEDLEEDFDDNEDKE